MATCETVQKKKRGPKPLATEEVQRRLAKVLVLYDLGTSAAKISKKLHFSAGRYLAQLMSEGRAKPLKTGPKESPYDINNPRVQTIIRMKKTSCATLKEMGVALHLTKERVRQLVKKIAQLHGPEVFEPEVKTLWTVKEAAAITGGKSEYISILCKKGKIPFKRRGEKHYLITKKGIDVLKLYFSAERTCANCGEKFTQKSYAGQRKFCYKNACEKKQRAQYKDNYLADKGRITASLKGWRKALWEAIQKRPVAGNEIWVEFSRAVEVSGLTNIQVSYLRMCGLISTRPKPVTRKTRKENRVRRRESLYSLGEMEIAREIMDKAKQEGTH